MMITFSHLHFCFSKRFSAVQAGQTEFKLWDMKQANNYTNSKNYEIKLQQFCSSDMTKYTQNDFKS